jgi:hypothetical protein
MSSVKELAADYTVRGESVIDLSLRDAVNFKLQLCHLR